MGLPSVQEFMLGAELDLAKNEIKRLVHKDEELRSRLDEFLHERDVTEEEKEGLVLKLDISKFKMAELQQVIDKLNQKVTRLESDKSWLVGTLEKIEAKHSEQTIAYKRCQAKGELHYGEVLDSRIKIEELNKNNVEKAEIIEARDRTIEARDCTIEELHKRIDRLQGADRIYPLNL